MDPNSTDGQDSFDNFLAVAQLGTDAFLAHEAITSPRPSTYAVNSQGQMIASGGGASSAASLLPSTGSGWLTLLVVVVLLFAFLRH